MIMFLLFACCFLLCMETIHATYEVVLEKIESATEGEGKDRVFGFEGVRVKKFNRTSYVVNGKYELKLPLDDSYDMFIEAFNFQGGQYKKMGDRKLEKVCKTLYIDAFRKEYDKFLETLLVKIPFGTCPVPVGKNQITNWMVSDNGILPPYIPGGEKWKIFIRYLKGDEVLGGYNVYVLLRNEQSILLGG